SIFYTLLAAFFLIGGGVLFYVNGWRLDPTTFALRKVGGIFVRSFPREAQITLDKEVIKNRSGFFQNGTLINNLFPKTYELRLSSPGYKPWVEKVSVAPALVSDKKNAVLIPEDSRMVATGTIPRFSMFNDELILGSKSGALSLKGVRIGNGVVLGYTNDLSRIFTFDETSGAYATFNVNTKTRTNLNAALVKAGFDTKRKFKLILDPYDAQNLLLLEPTAISTFNPIATNVAVQKKTANTIFQNAAASQFFFAWSEWNRKTNTSTITIYDKFLDKIQSTSESFGGKNIELAWVSTSKIAILQDDGGLYVYDRNKDVLAKIADDVKTFSFVSDASAVAALEHSALEIFFFSQDKDYYRFNLPDMQSAKAIEWYGDFSHLFVHYPSEVKFLDLKDGALVNFTPVVETSFASYDEKTNTLYWVANEGVKQTDFPR
ncbi:MAG: hypothetical protein Q8P49_04190, partial [Candidatus Liptonbacteria bacterium]|nr:hypothetical protein [Candidatus Liptonbacteria bacterium]